MLETDSYHKKLLNLAFDTHYVWIPGSDLNNNHIKSAKMFNKYYNDNPFKIKL